MSRSSSASITETPADPADASAPYITLSDSIWTDVDRWHCRPLSSYPDIPIDTQRQIRVFDLWPGGFADEICGELSVYTLDAPQHVPNPLRLQYNALSYTWGDWLNHAVIELNGQKDFPVTRNLWSALRRLRRIDEARRLWVDQICICQDRLLERNHQVALMGHVFSQAHRVLVWLGDSDTAKSRDIRVSDFRLDSPTYPAPDHPRQDLRHAITSESPTWWTRAWVVQEFVLAKEEPLACFGLHMLEWSRVAELGGVFDKTDFSEMAKHILSLRHNASRSIINLAWVLAQTSCQKAVDKIFSITGLLSAKEREYIDVDYNNTVDHTFAQATHGTIITTRNLGILALIRPSAFRRLEGLPSWVVDLTFNQSRSMVHQELDADFAARSGRFMKRQPISWTVKQENVEPQLGSYAQLPRSLDFRISGLVFGTVKSCFATSGISGHPDVLSRKARLKYNLRRMFTDHDYELLFSKEERTLFYRVGKLLEVHRPYQLLEREAKEVLEGVSTTALSDLLVKHIEDLKADSWTLPLSVATYLAQTWIQSTTGHVAGLVWDYRGFLHIDRDGGLEASALVTDFVDYLTHFCVEDGVSQRDYHCYNQSHNFLVTSNGFLGFGTNEMREGDTIVLPYGSHIR